MSAHQRLHQRSHQPALPHHHPSPPAVAACDRFTALPRPAPVLHAMCPATILVGSPAGDGSLTPQRLQADCTLVPHAARTPWVLCRTSALPLAYIGGSTEPFPRCGRAPVPLPCTNSGCLRERTLHA